MLQDNADRYGSFTICSGAWRAAALQFLTAAARILAETRPLSNSSGRPTSPSVPC